MNFEITVPPASEPISTADAKKHLEIEAAVTDHDDFFAALVKSARSHTEQYLGIGLLTQTVVQYWDEFPSQTKYNPHCGLYLLPGEIQSITSLKYLDTDGDEQTLTVTTQYKADLKSYAPKLVPAYNTTWPASRDEVNAVYCEYVRGWTSASLIPADIIQAMRLMIAKWFECREDSVQRMPTASQHLLDYWKNYAL